MTLYVNDMLLSGPQEAHEGFWKAPARHLEFDEHIPVDRILGRKHEVNRNEEGATIRCSLADFAKSSCEAYEALSKQKLTKASTPYVPDGSLLDTDWETQGVLAENASVDGETTSSRPHEEHWRLDQKVDPMVGCRRQTLVQTHDLYTLHKTMF